MKQNVIHIINSTQTYRNAAVRTTVNMPRTFIEARLQGFRDMRVDRFTYTRRQTNRSVSHPSLGATKQNSTSTIRNSASRRAVSRWKRSVCETGYFFLLQKMCGGEWRPSRVESECIVGDGVTFYYPDVECSPFLGHPTGTPRQSFLTLYCTKLTKW